MKSVNVCPHCGAKALADADRRPRWTAFACEACGKQVGVTRVYLMLVAIVALGVFFLAGRLDDGWLRIGIEIVGLMGGITVARYLVPLERR